MADAFALADRPPLWTDASKRGFERALTHGATSEAMAVLARWWQLETWLRLLVYLEARANLGATWTNVLPDRSRVLAERDAENAYMPSPDASNPLAYISAGQLFALIGSNEVWPLVEYALIKRQRWDGIVDHLLSIRNRMAHARRPHVDDLSRIEQALRDLEPGARLALEAFNRQHQYPDEPLDRLSVAWVAGQHDDAKRLIDHAERQYDTAFRLMYSRRPWGTIPDDEAVSGQPGLLIHATWFMRDGALLAPKSFWNDKTLDFEGVRDLIVLVTHEFEGEVSVTFSGADDPDAIADAIGSCFELVLRHRDRTPSERRRKRWLIEAQGMDWRVQVDTPILVTTEDQPFSIFGA